jgi:hypothetical protein
MAIVSSKKFQYNELQVIKDGYLLCFVSLQGSILLLLLTSYKMLSNIILSRLNPYIYEVTGDHQCGF